MNKKDFPIFKQKINGHPLVYLDSAATSQKPQYVLDAVNDYYKKYNANVRRGIYPLAEKATAKVEQVRRQVKTFINAKSEKEIIFVRNSTEALNLIMYSFESHNISAGDRVMTTIAEHHSNFVPWQQLCKQKKAVMEVLDITENFTLAVDQISFKHISLLAIGHVSNVLGTINPIKAIIKKAKKENPNIFVVVDAAQSVPHIAVDVQDLDCDFLVFSGHKMLAGTGIGILYGKEKLLSSMQPFLFGSDMIKEVTIDHTIFDNLPGKFEAGTPDIAGIVSLGTAIEYLEKVGMKNIQKTEKKLTDYALEKLKLIDGLVIYGPKNLEGRSGVISFTLGGIHAHDVAQVLGDMGICVRAGHHCAMPLHKRLGIVASVRASFYLYNDEKDIDRLITGLQKVRKIFKE